MKNQAQRILTAAIAIPLALLLVWYGGLLLVLLLVIVGVLGTGELFRLAERAGVRPLRPLGLVLAGAGPLLTWLITTPIDQGLDPLESLVATVLLPFYAWAPWPMLALLVPVLILSAALLWRPPDQHPLAAAAVSLLGPVYCALLPAPLLLIRFAAGANRSIPAAVLVFFPLVVTWLCDSFAMWGGKAIGGPKLWPSVSPGKTRSGAVAGVIGGMLAAIAYAALALPPAGWTLSLPAAATFGLIISVVAQVGDLVESLFKREAGVKDSGSLIPGHGGVLDRFDSLYFVVPVSAFLFRVFGVL